MTTATQPTRATTFMTTLTPDLFQPTSLAVDFRELPAEHVRLTHAGCSILGMTVNRKRGEYELRLWWPVGTQIAARQPSQAEFFASEGTKAAYGAQKRAHLAARPHSCVQ